MTEQPRSHNTSSPLFLLLAPQSAHTPLEAPDEYLDMFADISDHNRRVFSAMVAAMDVMVGRVIEALRESHLYENSLIVFVSDNGAASKQVIASQGSQDVRNLSVLRICLPCFRYQTSNQFPLREGAIGLLEERKQPSGRGVLI